MSMTPKRSEVAANEPLKVVPANQAQFFVGLEPTKGRFRGQVIHKDGFGQKVVFV